MAETDSAAKNSRSHFYLVDGSGFIFRAFHALPPMSRPDGTPTNAVFGFSEEQVEHARRVIAAWDSAESQGKGVAVLDGKLVETMHVDEARRILSIDAG